MRSTCIQTSSFFNLGIYLECQGYAKFCFNELSSETYYSTEETYLDLKIPLIAYEGWFSATFIETLKWRDNSRIPYTKSLKFFCWQIVGRERFELVSGVHQFPFSFVLPTKIPSSFQTEMLSKFGYGHVRYSIKVVLKRSSRQPNSETCNIPFTVCLKLKPSLTIFQNLICFFLGGFEAVLETKLRIRDCFHSKNNRWSQYHP